jgi:hypothetical protein
MKACGFSGSVGSMKAMSTVETRFHAFLVDVAEDVCREGDDGLVGLLGAFLPAAEFFARLVAVFVGHVEITL